MPYDATAHARELAADQARLDAITDCVKVELQKLGIDCALDVAKSEGNPDARFIRCNDARLNIRASFIRYGANKGRIDWQGYAHRREFHRSDVPHLGETTSAPDATAKRIAKAIASRIIEPASEPVAKYNATADTWDAHRAELPKHVATVRAMGFDVREPQPGATEADFYLSGLRGISGSVRINSNGGAYLDRVSLDPETARAVLEFLAVRPKG